MSKDSNQYLRSFAATLVRLKVPFSLFVIIMTALLAIPAAQLSFDESIESFFSPDSEMLQQYLESKQTFGGDEFLIVGFPVEDATERDTLDEIEELSAQLAQVPGVRPESMQDLASILRNKRAPGWMRVAMRLPSFKRSILRESEDMLLSKDRQTVAIAMRLTDQKEAPVPRAETFRQVREIAASHDPPAVVAGEPLQVHDMFRYVEDDSLKLGIGSSVVLMAVILLLFRSLRWVILPICLIYIVLTWTMGLLHLSGFKLSMVSSMLTSLVTIIVIALIMHVILVFREQRSTHDRYQSFLATFSHLATPILLTCLTTAIGFAALLISNVVPVRSFAIMMAFATLLIPVLCLFVFPVGILTGKREMPAQAPVGESKIVALLQRFCLWSNRHPRIILCLTFGLGFWATIGLSKIQVETDFSQNFKQDSQIVQAIDFFESRMGGIGSWEVSFPAPAELNEEFLDQVRELTAELRTLKMNESDTGKGGLTKVISLTDGLDLIPKVPLDTSGAGRLIPVVRRLRPATLAEKQEMLAALQPEVQPSLHNPEKGRMRIMLRALERQPAEVKLALIQRVEEISRRYFPDAEATGLYVLLANLISSLLDDQLLSFLLAALGVILMMGISFRNWRVGLISLFPNVLPILVLIGGMSWLGIPINIGTAMIASVSLGLTVDSTIHYLSTYLRHRQAGMTHLEATQLAHGNVGLALLLANLGLVAGFSVLTLSNFIPLADFGILVSFAMVGGLLSNIFLMPVLLKWLTFPTPVSSVEHVA